MDFFFDELSSTEPPDCKTNKCHSMPLGHFPKIRQIQNDRSFEAALTGKYFDVIKYSQIIYRWLAMTFYAVQLLQKN